MSLKFITPFIIFLIIFFGLTTAKVHAIENPFSSFNNKFGVHILFPDELFKAAELVNSNGGDWGYVVIPIQSGDKDLAKWQQFMEHARINHIIPIIRLATEGDYFNTRVWRKPTENDIVDFANFLDSLDWPVKNRYIIVYNEVNRADEWGGAVDPTEYANLLNYAITIFKSKNPDFFILSAGLDNAAPEFPPQYKNEYNFYNDMNKAIPGIFSQIDGMASHSYPNPGFSQPPTATGKMSIKSFDFERQLLKTLGAKDLPVFITETGWSGDVLSDSARADYYQHAFKSVWSDKGIVAVAPFLLRANGSFQEFSLTTTEGNPTRQFEALKSISKVRGFPPLALKTPPLLKLQKSVLGISTIDNFTEKKSEVYRDFSNEKKPIKKYSLTNITLTALRWLIGT